MKVKTFAVTTLTVLLVCLLATGSLGVGVIGLAATGTFAETSGPSQHKQSTRVLNNLVTEYVNTAIIKRPDRDYLRQPFNRYTIKHFRDGWVFISAIVEGGSGYVTIDSDAKEDAVLTFPGDEKNPVETMRYTSKGSHEIKVFTRGRPLIKKLVVRSIPQIMIAELSFAVPESYASNPNYNRVRAYSWDFYRKHINPNVNILCSTPDSQGRWEPYANEFRASGKKWVFKESIDWSLLKEKGSEAFEEHCYNAWSKMLEQNPFLDGLALDEWTTDETVPHAYPVFARVFDRIAQNPACRGKKFHVYGMPLRPALEADDPRSPAVGLKIEAPAPPVREWYAPGIESIMRNGFEYIQENYYILEDKGGNEEEQKALIEMWGGNRIANTWPRRYPEIIANNLSYSIGPYSYHYSFDQTPAMDYKVYLDMQFEHVATHPGLRNLSGINIFVTRCTTKDTLLHVSRLIRHYCIDGKKERLRRDPLKLPHLRNPGFEEGLAYWKIEASESGSVRSVLRKDLPFETKFSYQLAPTGDKVLVTVPSVKAPNLISQKIAGLTPGRLYSLSVCTADLTDFHTPRKMIPVSIRLKNVTEISDESEDNDVTTKDYKDGEVGCMNYHFRMFRAKAPEAELTLMDWPNIDIPSNLTGHQIMWDHVKVSPL